MQKHLHECAFVNLYVCVRNTEVAVVFMPAIRMLSLPTALFHLTPTCVRVCVCVHMCNTALDVPAVSSSAAAGHTQTLSESNGATER